MYTCILKIKRSTFEDEKGFVWKIFTILQKEVIKNSLKKQGKPSSILKCVVLCFEDISKEICTRNVAAHRRPDKHFISGFVPKILRDFEGGGFGVIF